jgi:hypothetical protein
MLPRSRCLQIGDCLASGTLEEAVYEGFIVSLQAGLKKKVHLIRNERKPVIIQM